MSSSAAFPASIPDDSLSPAESTTFPDASTAALLAEEGIEVDRLVRDGQVQLQGAGDVYLSASGFDPEAVIARQ